MEERYKPTNISLLAYVLVAYAIAWLCWFFVALTGVNAMTNIEAGVVVLLGGFSPSIAAIIFIWRKRDRAYEVDFWQRTFDLRRIKWVWWLPILLLYPLSVLLAHLISGIPVDTSPLDALLQNPGAMGVTLIFVFLFGPFAEELGWRGYFLDQLQIRYSAFVASMIVGVVWWGWHLPTIAVEGMFLDATVDPVFLAGYFGTLLLYSVLFTWVYNNNQRSVMAAILMHFSINLTSRLIAMPAEIFMITTGVLIAFVVVILLGYGTKELMREGAFADDFTFVDTVQ